MVHTTQNDNDKTSVRFALMNNTQFLTLKGMLWGIFHELYKEKWSQYVKSAQYLILLSSHLIFMHISRIQVYMIYIGLSLFQLL